MLEAFKTLEEQYWELYRPIFLEQYINPLNIADEKEKFSKAWKNNSIYNPQFIYKSLDFSFSEISTKFKRLNEAFIKNDHVLSRYYVEHIEETLEALQHLSNRKTKTFSTWLTAQYGRPSKKLLKQAQELLSTLDQVVKEEQSIDATEVLEIFTQALQERGFKGWKISIEEMPARMSINQMLKRVKIKASAKFSLVEIERLKVHEIDTHILRAENAKKQPYLLFQYGFPRYLKTEEGLAIFSEKQSGLLSEYDKQKYALRVLASEYASNHGFYDLFVYLNKYIDENDAFDMAVRVKRGLIDTSVKGGYTKDQVYLGGYFTVKSMLPEDRIKLYYGKLGVDDLYVVNSLLLNEDLNYPKWV